MGLSMMVTLRTLEEADRVCPILKESFFSLRNNTD